MDERSDTATDSPLGQLISYNGERWIVDAITNNGDHALLNLLGNAGVVVRVPVEEIREIVMSKPESQTAIRSDRATMAFAMVLARLQRKGIALEDMSPEEIKQEVNEAVADIKAAEEALS